MPLVKDFNLKDIKIVGFQFSIAKNNRMKLNDFILFIFCYKFLLKQLAVCKYTFHAL